PIKLRQMKQRCHDLEEEIARLETAIADTETALQTFISAEETKRQSDALAQHRTDLAACMAEWEELATVLEPAELSDTERPPAALIQIKAVIQPCDRVCFSLR